MTEKSKILIAAHKEIRYPERFLVFFNTSNAELDHRKYADSCVFNQLLFADMNIKGFYQYRRFLVTHNNPIFYFLNVFKFHGILDLNKISFFLNQGYDLVLPKKHKFSMTLYDQYGGYPAVKNDLLLTKKIIDKFYPIYSSSFEKIIFGTEWDPYFHNIMFAKKKIFDEYSVWLLDILSRVDQLIDYSNRDESETRALGYISERLLNVYIYHNNLNVKEFKLRTLTKNQSYPSSGFKYLYLLIKYRLRVIKFSYEEFKRK
jgi:hypothetical protein